MSEQRAARARFSRLVNFTDRQIREMNEAIKMAMRRNAEVNFAELRRKSCFQRLNDERLEALRTMVSNEIKAKQKQQQLIMRRQHAAMQAEVRRREEEARAAARRQADQEAMILQEELAYAEKEALEAEQDAMALAAELARAEASLLEARDEAAASAKALQEVEEKAARAEASFAAAAESVKEARCRADEASQQVDEEISRRQQLENKIDNLTGELKSLEIELNMARQQDQDSVGVARVAELEKQWQEQVAAQGKLKQEKEKADRHIALLTKTCGEYVNRLEESEKRLEEAEKRREEAEKYAAEQKKIATDLKNTFRLSQECEKQLKDLYFNLRLPREINMTSEKYQKGIQECIAKHNRDFFAAKRFGDVVSEWRQIRNTIIHQTPPELIDHDMFRVKSEEVFREVDKTIAFFSEFGMTGRR